jgi:hypothetical protein
MVDSAIDGPRCGQQSRKCVVPTFQDFLTKAIGCLSKLIVKGGNSVVLAVDRVRDRQQIALFGEEEKDQSHHDGEGGFIYVFLGNTLEKPVAILTVSAVECPHKHLYGTAYLATEGCRDLLLVLEATAIQRIERLFRRPIEQSIGRKQISEGPQREALFKP